MGVIISVCVKTNLRASGLMLMDRLGHCSPSASRPESPHRTAQQHPWVGPTTRLASSSFTPPALACARAEPAAGDHRRRRRLIARGEFPGTPLLYHGGLTRFARLSPDEDSRIISGGREHREGESSLKRMGMKVQALMTHILASSDNSESLKEKRDKLDDFGLPSEDLGMMTTIQHSLILVKIHRRSYQVQMGQTSHLTLMIFVTRLLNLVPW
uniref:Uncharacterized protein n=1 Tax=Oryza brachyantha TaxID=4533 RepID=J3M8Y0_ORYBR